MFGASAALLVDWHLRNPASYAMFAAWSFWQ
jgi:hypothetical protein